MGKRKGERELEWGEKSNCDRVSFLLNMDSGIIDRKKKKKKKKKKNLKIHTHTHTHERKKKEKENLFNQQ